MSFCLYLDKDYVADFASNGGWIDFAKWGRSLADSPELKSLCDDGLSEHVVKLLEELRAAPQPADESIAETLAGFIDSLESADIHDADDQVVIISDGFGDEPEEE